MRAAILPTDTISAENLRQRLSPPVLRIKSVRKLYRELEAIRNVSFDVAACEFVSVLGPSGCGKSTLLMMVAGVIDRTDGEISINGTPVIGPRPEVGVVFQQGQFSCGLVVF